VIPRSPTTPQYSADGTGLPVTRMEALEHPPLEMRWPGGHPPAPPLPDGYTLAACVREREFVSLQSRAGWQMREGQWDDLIGRLIQGSMVFCADSGGDHVAVACMTTNETWGELGWVAVVPEHRGRSLARVICAASMGAALRQGHIDLRLTTQDQRLSAIKTYVNLGWVPWITDASTDRWRVVLAELGLR
jgi:mycothiol synthase